MKRNILYILLFVVVLVAYGTYRLGDRKVTITVDGAAAAGEKVRMMGSGEILELDDAGTLDLPWGLSEMEDSRLFFQTGNTNVWIFRMPAQGTLHFDITGSEVTTEFERSYGLFKLKKQVTQQAEPVGVLSKKRPGQPPLYGPRVGVDPFADEGDSAPVAE